MKRPKLKDFSKGTLASLNEHQIALIEWAWFAEDRIEELTKQLSIHDVSVPKGTLCDHPEDMRHGTGYLECQYCINCGEQIV